ncbi:MAG: hypothetical protein ACLSAF_16965 [Intestinimonas sp.]
MMTAACWTSPAARLKNVTQYALMSLERGRGISGGTFASDTYAVVNRGSSASTTDGAQADHHRRCVPFAGTAGIGLQGCRRRTTIPASPAVPFSSDVSAYAITGLLPPKGAG